MQLTTILGIEGLTVPTHTDHANSSNNEAVKTGAQHDRSDPRYHVAASIKVVDVKSGKQIVSLTSNVSRNGCHVRTATPFQQGTRVKVTIEHQGSTFENDGKVAYAIPGAGMGLHFENEAAEEDPLDEWIALLGNELIERVREKVTPGKEKVILLLFTLALAAAVGGLLVWLGVLR